MSQKNNILQFPSKIDKSSKKGKKVAILNKHTNKHNTLKYNFNKYNNYYKSSSHFNYNITNLLSYTLLNSLTTKLNLQTTSKLGRNKVASILNLYLSNLFINRGWIKVRVTQYRKRDKERAELKNYTLPKLPSSKFLKIVQDYLFIEGYISKIDAKYFASVNKRNKTIIKATDKLIELFNLYSEEIVKNLEFDYSFNITLYKRIEKKKVRARVNTNNSVYEYTSKVLSDYTNLMSKVVITTNKRIFNNIEFRRIFNESPDLNIGGRLFTNIDKLTRDERKTMLFNGNKTVEVDFTSIHILLLYNKAGINLGDADLYDFPGYPRDICKLATLIFLNSKSEKEGISAVATKVIFPSKELGFIEGYSEEIQKCKKEAAELLIALKHKHSQIKHFFNQGLAGELQNRDSVILFKVMEQLNALNIPYFTVHDSVIVEEKHNVVLQNIMTTTLESFLHIKVGIKLVS